jgi:hypothetical protein
MSGDPLKDLSVSLTCLQLNKEGLWINPCKLDEVFVKWAVVMILAILCFQLGAPLVEHARKNDKTAEAGARAAWWACGEIHGRGGRLKVFRLKAFRSERRDQKDEIPMLWIRIREGIFLKV